MSKHFRLGLAVAIATTVSTSMTAIAQEAPEAEDFQPPDQALPDSGSTEVVYTQTSHRSVAVESTPIVEFSQPAALPVEAVASAPPVVDSIRSAPIVDAVAVVPTPAAQDRVTASQSAPIAQAVVVPVKPVVPVAPIAQPMAQPAIVRPSPVSAVESRPDVEFAPAAKPVSTKAIAANVAQTQIRVEQTSGAPTVVQSPNPQALQNQLQQLQQQQQQLQQQINTLQQQIVIPNKTAVAPTPNRQGLKVTGEALFWKPGTSDTLDYAISDPGTALATSGNVETTELGKNTGGRFGLNYRLPNSGLDVGGNYTFFNTTGSSSATAPTGGFLFSTQSHPFQNETAETANSTATLGYKTGDFEAGYNIKAGNAADIRLFGGVRASNVDRNITTNYNGRDYTDGQIVTQNRFTGAGPRIGAEAKVPLGAGFSLFGRAAASMQVGNLTSNFRETDRAGADVIADVERKQGSHVVPGLELAAGLSWEKALSKRAKVNLSGGYETQNLFNVTNNARFVDAASPGVFSQSSNDLSLKGFFVKGGVSVEF